MALKYLKANCPTDFVSSRVSNAVVLFATLTVMYMIHMGQPQT